MHALAPPPTPASIGSNVLQPPKKYPFSFGPMNVTRPLSVRRKRRPQRPTIKTSFSDKENAIEDDKHRTLGDKGIGKAGLGGKRVHIVEPTAKERSKLRKKSAGPFSPGFSGVGSPFALPSPSLMSPISLSPKRRWLDHVFKFKPTTLSLLSVQDIHTTQSECTRLLIGMGVQVIPENSAGLGILRCRLEEVKDPSGAMSSLTPVKFRVELRESSARQDDGAFMVVLTLIHEKGSIETLREVHKRLTRDWRLDVVGSTAPREMGEAPVLVTV